MNYAIKIAMFEVILINYEMIIIINLLSILSYNQYHELGIFKPFWLATITTLSKFNEEKNKWWDLSY